LHFRTRVYSHLLLLPLSLMLLISVPPLFVWMNSTCASHHSPVIIRHVVLCILINIILILIIDIIFIIDIVLIIDIIDIIDIVVAFAAFICSFTSTWITTTAATPVATI
jgi:hypothetical protein